MINAVETLESLEFSMAGLRGLFGPTAVEVATITASIVLLAIILMIAGTFLMALLVKIMDSARIRGIRKRMRGEA